MNTQVSLLFASYLSKTRLKRSEMIWEKEYSNENSSNFLILQSNLEAHGVIKQQNNILGGP